LPADGKELQRQQSTELKCNSKLAVSQDSAGGRLSGLAMPMMESGCAATSTYDSCTILTGHRRHQAEGHHPVGCLCQPSEPPRRHFSRRHLQHLPPLQGSDRLLAAPHDRWLLPAVVGHREEPLLQLQGWPRRGSRRRVRAQWDASCRKRVGLGGLYRPIVHQRLDLGNNRPLSDYQPCLVMPKSCCMMCLILLSYARA
jgi:hypothetical protein